MFILSTTAFVQYLFPRHFNFNLDALFADGLVEHHFCLRLQYAVLPTLPALHIRRPLLVFVCLIHHAVLALSAIKDGFEDYGRYKSDLEINNRSSLVYDPVLGDFAKKLWQDIRVGDLVRLDRNQSAPVDLLLLVRNYSFFPCDF